MSGQVQEKVDLLIKLYITRSIAAEMLGVNPSMVSAYIKGGRLEGAFKLGQAWAIPRVSVEKLAKARPKGGFKRGRKKRDDDSKA